MRCLTPDVCAAVMAASLSFFACLQGLQRLGSFFKPLSWKKACSPEVQIKFSLQSTHLMVRSGCSGVVGAAKSMISSLCDMISSPGVGLLLCRAAQGGAALGNAAGSGEYRVSEAALVQAKRMSESITMAKLCQDKNQLILIARKLHD